MNSPLMSLASTLQPQRPSRTARHEDVVVSPDGSATEPPSSEQFASVLALLAGNNPQLRADLVKQLPPEGASLVDRLLAGSANPDGTSVSTSAFSNSASSASSAAEASEALRYGLLSVLPKEPTGQTNAALAALTTSRGSRSNGLAMAALARTATQRGTSVEQLLALGDTQGADMRAMLDALLAKAGTAAGMQLATAATSASAAALPVDAPMRDLGGVSPELKEKLQRVMDRMQAEFGHDVRVVEGVRSQERQDWLFEQGRTRDGQVVTWTRDSAHTRGEAVDVIIDGSYGNAEAYARLQQIAREEGLRTLGMKDPGHLELPRGASSVASTMAPTTNPMPMTVSMPSGERMAAPASTAGQASVAGIAGVASVAGVAGTAPAASPATGSAFGAAAQAAFSSITARDSHNASQGGGEHRHAQSGSERESTTRHEGVAMPTIGQIPSASFAGAFEASAATRAASSIDQTQRIADIDQLRAGANHGPLSRVTLDLPSENGASERITIDMRGNTVNTTIVTDAELANRLRMQSADLQDALGRHGLDADSVRISGRAPEASDGVSGLGDRDALALSGASSTAHTDTGASQDRERATRQHDRQDDARREPSARDRNDREQQERQQQDRERFLNYLKGVE